MSLLRIQQDIGYGSSKDGHVGEGNGVFGTKSKDENVNGHENAASTDASAGSNHEAQRARDKAVDIGRVEWKEGFVKLIDDGSVMMRLNAVAVLLPECALLVVLVVVVEGIAIAALVVVIGRRQQYGSVDERREDDGGPRHGQSLHAAEARGRGGGREGRLHHHHHHGGLYVLIVW